MRVLVLGLSLSFIVVACTPTKPLILVQEPAKEKPAKADPLALVREFNSHIWPIVKLLGQAQADCKKVIADARKYIAEHEAETGQLRARLDSAEKSMSPEEKENFGHRVERESRHMLEQYMLVMGAFGMRCPDELVNLGNAMWHLTGK